MPFGRPFLLKTIDAIVGPPMCRILGHLAKAPHNHPDLTDANISRILVIRPGGLGDMLLLLPIIEELKLTFPAATIDVLCEKRNRQVIAMADLSCEPLVYDVNPLQVLNVLRKRKYDISIDTEQFHHFSAILGLLSGAPIRIGFKINPLRNPMYTHLINYALDGPEGQQFGKLLAPLGISSIRGQFSGMLAGHDLHAEGLSSQVTDLLTDGNFMAIHPGSSSVYKQWPADRFAEVASHICRQHGLVCVLLGDATDKTVAENIAATVSMSNCKAMSLAATLSLPATAQVLKSARVFVSPDSGLAHLATALDVPTVTLFGPSDHEKWGATGSAHEIVRTAVPCAPCFIFGYHKPCTSKECMKKIQAADVTEAVNRVLATS